MTATATMPRLTFGPAALETLEATTGLPAVEYLARAHRRGVKVGDAVLMLHACAQEYRPGFTLADATAAMTAAGVSAATRDIQAAMLAGIKAGTCG